MKTTLKGEILEWARLRAGLSEEQLAKKIFGKTADETRVREWERTGELTFHQAELIAEKTYTPFGLLFLDKPPKENLPIKDFRTVGGSRAAPPTPNLLDVIYECQRRQAWYRDYLISDGASPFNFVGTGSTSTPVKTTASAIRDRIKIGSSLSVKASTRDENLALHFAAAEEAGILVMRNGVVGNNNRRKLSVDEFRGFALSDDFAPLVFINTGDAKAAQLFTLAHEIVHIWLGESAVSNLQQTYAGEATVERYCNEVAAELLVPADEIARRWAASSDPFQEIRRLASQYKVSTLVVSRRARDLSYISQKDFREFHAEQLRQFVRSEEKVKNKEDGGGDFHNTLRARASGLFCNALIASTLSGKTTYSEAFYLLGVRGTDSFQSFAKAKFGHLMK